MSKLPKTRGADGYCNICDSYGPLTWDHVPPKGAIVIKPMEMKTFVRWLFDANPGRVNLLGDAQVLDQMTRKRASNGGVRFRTICAECNNSRLGGRYDPELKRVAERVGTILRAATSYGLHMPDRIPVPVRTHFLLRAVIGHLLAAETPADSNVPLPGRDSGFYRELRDYFLDESLPLPETVRIYYWPFASQDQVIVRGLGLLLNGSAAALIGDLIKFFPLAYYVVDVSRQSVVLPVPEIHGNGCNDLDCEISLIVTPALVPPVTWPEAPGPDHSSIMPAGLAVRSAPRAPRRRR